jgi:hypothetical protein
MAGQAMAVEYVGKGSQPLSPTGAAFKRPGTSASLVTDAQLRDNAAAHAAQWTSTRQATASPAKLRTGAATALRRRKPVHLEVGMLIDMGPNHPPIASVRAPLKPNHLVLVPDQSGSMDVVMDRSGSTAGTISAEQRDSVNASLAKWVEPMTRRWLGKQGTGTSQQVRITDSSGTREVTATPMAVTKTPIGYVLGGPHIVVDKSNGKNYPLQRGAQIDIDKSGATAAKLPE